MMKKKLKTILLIDDDEPTLFYNKLIIKRANCAENVVCCQTGSAALDYLKAADDSGKYARPDIIFLDINMPVLNGWDFLKEYNKLTKEQQGKIIVVMLTTSLNPEDKARAESLGYISKFLNKPLKKEALLEVIETHYPELF